MENTPSIRNKSQVIIEFILMFVALAMLILGISRIWVFFNADFANRQPSYEATRLVAGDPRGSPGEWPPRGYSAIYLTEDWVLKGEPNTERDTPFSEGDTGSLREGNVCRERQRAQNLLEEANRLWERAGQLDEEAAQLRREAKDLEEEAEELDAQAEAIEARCSRIFWRCSQEEKSLMRRLRWKAEEKRREAREKRALAEQKEREAEVAREQAGIRADEAQELLTQAADNPACTGSAWNY